MLFVAGTAEAVEQERYVSLGLIRIDIVKRVPAPHYCRAVIDLRFVQIYRRRFDPTGTNDHQRVILQIIERCVPAFRFPRRLEVCDDGVAPRQVCHASPEFFERENWNPGAVGQLAVQHVAASRSVILAPNRPVKPSLQERFTLAWYSFLNLAGVAKIPPPWTDTTTRLPSGVLATLSSEFDVKNQLFPGNQCPGSGASSGHPRRGAAERPSERSDHDIQTSRADKGNARVRNTEESPETGGHLREPGSQVEHEQTLRRFLSYDRFQVGPDDSLDAAVPGLREEVFDSGTTPPSPAPESFERNLHADPVPELECVRDRLLCAVDPQSDAVNRPCLDTFTERLPREPIDIKGWIVDSGRLGPPLELRCQRRAVPAS